MKFVIAFFSLLFVHLSVNGQMADSVKSAITTLLLEKKVAEKVFYDYDMYEWKNYAQDDWKGEKIKLPTGRYAFIWADTIFEKKYKGIISEIRNSVMLNGIIFKREFYKDSVKAMYIGWDLITELVVVFKKIEVTSETASINFYISSRVNQERFVDRYSEVTGYLHKENKRWVVDKCKIEPRPWYEYSRRLMAKDLYRKK